MNIKGRKLHVRSLCIGLAIALLLTMFAGMNVTAAFSGGSGTKADPYIVKTAQDLDNIRNNLAAHYKLGATIDMSSFGVFEPIGTGIMDENKSNDQDTYNPFTGSFVCDMGADGLPRYAILNLNVYNSIGKDFGYAFGSPNYAGFGEKGNHYLAALFGITEGATLTNIVLLNAKVENTVPGQHGGVGGFDDEERGYTIVKNQVDSTATAGLVGFAKATAVTGCGVQGKIISTTNQTGGLVGAAERGTTVTNCWSDCEIEGQGYWSNAGFIGRVNLSNVQSCYAKGSLTFTDNHVAAKNSPPTAPAGFIKTISSDSTVSDCYSEVVTKGDLNSFSFAEEVGNLLNCYTTGIKKGKTDVSANETKATVKNCWILNQAGANQSCFKAGSMNDIKNAFASQKNWDTTGKAPTLKNAYYITDYKIYKAGAERPGANASQNQGGTSTSPGGTTSSSTTQSGSTGTGKPQGGTTNSSTVQSGTTNSSTVQGGNTTTSKPQGSTVQGGNTTTSKPQGSTVQGGNTTTSKPQGNATTSKPQGDATTSQQQSDNTANESTPQGNTTNDSAQDTGTENDGFQGDGTTDGETILDGNVSTDEGIIDNGQGDAIQNDGSTNENAGTGENGGETVGETSTQTVTEEVSNGYIILCLCLAALTIAISASSVITLLNAMKQKKLLSEESEGEEDYE